jgi:biotin--protein ligase
VQPTELPQFLNDLADIIVRDENGKETIKGANDTFMLERAGGIFSVGKLKDAISSVLPSSIAPSTTSGSADNTASRENEISQRDEGMTLDYDKVVKRIFVHEEGFPSAKETPYFNFAAYYANWAAYIRDTNGTEGLFGKNIIYGEVVTSTNTLLDK